MKLHSTLNPSSVLAGDFGLGGWAGIGPFVSSPRISLRAEPPRFQGFAAKLDLAIQSLEHAVRLRKIAAPSRKREAGDTQEVVVLQALALRQTAPPAGAAPSFRRAADFGTLTAGSPNHMAGSPDHAGDFSGLGAASSHRKASPGCPAADRFHRAAESFCYTGKSSHLTGKPFHRTLSAQNQTKTGPNRASNL